MRKVKKSVSRNQIATQRVTDRMEVRREPVYSTITLPAGAVAGLRQLFFATAQGGSVNQITTDIVSPSQLPYPQRFTVSGMRLACYMSDARDYDFLVKLFKTSYVRFFVGNKDYHIMPLSLIAGGISAYFQGGQVDGSKAKIVSQLGTASKDGYQFALNKSVTIGSKENFGVDLQSTVNATLNSPVQLRLYLEGTKYVEVR